MSLPELCIRRPVMTTLLMLSFVVFGLFAYRQLPVAALPRVDFPTISVNAGLPGASADTMASSVAGPLERAFATIPGITIMTSSSALGTTNIVMQFDLDRNIDGAALDVQSNISATLRKLPPQLPAPPSFQKINPADSPVLFIALVSKTLPLYKVDDYAEQIFAEQISQISGVAQVLVFGQQKFAVRIAVDPDAAAARGLTLEQVNAAVAAANSSTPVGALLGKRQNMTVDATGQLDHAADYDNLVVAWRNGAPVRLKEIAHVYDSVENKQIAGWANGDPAVVLAVYRQSDANTVNVVDSVKAKIPYYQSQLPPSVDVRVLNDRSVSIRQSIDEVEKTLGLSILLVVIVIFVFLKSGSATLIPALALPVSLIGACVFMFAFGFSIDNISLLAITLSVGFVVDDAIVMLENITRHIEAGMKPFDAALKGSKEIAFTILSITFSLVAVFIPVLLMSGVVGRVFHEFAVTITVAILVSGFVSLTLTPMLCARILSAPKHGAAAGLFARASDALVDGLLAGYRVSLDFVLRYRLIALLLTFCDWLHRRRRSTRRSPKDSSPRRTPASCAASPKRRPTPASAKCRRRQITVSNLISKGSGDRLGHFGGRLRRRDQQGLPVRAPQGQGSARLDGSGDEPPAQRDGGDSGHSHPPAAGAEPRFHRRPHRARQVSIYAAIRRHRRALRQGAGDGAGDGASARPARRQQRSADHQSATARRHRPRQGGGLRHRPPIRCAPRSMTPSARGRSRPSSPRPTITR